MNPQGADIIDATEGDHGLAAILCRTPQGETFTLVVKDGEMVLIDPHADDGRPA